MRSISCEELVWLMPAGILRFSLSQLLRSRAQQPMLWFLVGIILACCLSQYITNNQYEMV
ncbi:hypothetical protein QYF61_004432 [Mycteria americana]|uniref:Uncharacterized protein n=1 Tax=Mycteria americana TaxID=33587 RepID=A0AAN7N7D6_MYCAM|nr:hypothetical protein QYF61_004432 [Mycteria americana]